MISKKSKGELIPLSPVATFDGSDLMISKTSRSEIVGILKSAELVRPGSVLMVLSMTLSATEIKCSLNTLDISSGVE